MPYITEVTLLKRKILSLISEKMFNGTLKEDLRNIAYILIPDDAKPLKCCIYFDRALTKQKIKLILGLDHIKYKNVAWSDIYNDFEKSNGKEIPLITVLRDACNGCPQKRYYITEACQHCLAHPCVLNCPKNAITIESDRAVIDEEKCVKCGICVKICPFNAIIEVHKPCEYACPTGAITTDENNIAVIDEEKCIYCGQCIIGCPFGAIVERTDILQVIKKIKENKNLVALVAPSAVGQFSPKATMKQLCTALKLIGFKKVYELAYFADLIAREEAAELKEKKAENQTLTSSCCPAWVYFARKVRKNFAKTLSNALSPMARAAEAKKGDEIFVFIGPCLSKKKEAESTAIDYVLTFEELACLFTAKKIDVLSCEESEFDVEGPRPGRIFAISGGVTEAIKHYAGTEFNTEKINGLDKDSIKYLQRLKGVDFIEVMACENGCIGGPFVVTNPKRTAKLIENAE
ncbi:monomeric [FeFe] hydrogenase [Caldithrix abyssi]